MLDTRYWTLDQASGCQEKLAGYKRPRRVVFVDELPKNQLGKVLYRELRNRFDPS
jgi:acyl-coenzyme A synthetase/AMP-(fatty) acid ligase